MRIFKFGMSSLDKCVSARLWTGYDVFYNLITLFNENQCSITKSMVYSTPMDPIFEALKLEVREGAFPKSVSRCL